MKVASSSRITAVSPLWAVEGGRVTVSGSGFELEPQLPEVRLGGVRATVTHASTRSLSIVVPPGLNGGHTPIRVDSAQGETAYVEVGAPIATGVHQVDNPVFDADGQSLRHLQRFTWTGSAGLDLRRPSRRIPRAVRRRTAQPDIDGH